MSSTRYRILGQVGQGQFGQVFCAIDRQTSQFVALKVFNKRELSTRLFLRELRLLTSLQHAHIVAVQTIAYTAKERYLVMDYCEGGTLRDLLVRLIHLSLEKRLQIIINVLKGLEYAHQRQVIHCDLKPENILLTYTATGWSAKITDFGIARLAEEAGYSVIGQGDTGSPAYMAPERFYSEYSYASDLYAMGVILFELLVGKRPFMGLPGELMTAHLNAVASIPASVPFLLRSILKTALQKLPQKRFKSAGEMLKALELAANGLAAEVSTSYHRASSQELPAETPYPGVYSEPLSSPVQCLLANPVTGGSTPTVLPEQHPAKMNKPDWLFLLDQRYRVAITSQAGQTQFQGFTRRGTALPSFSIPIGLQQITQSCPHPYQLFAIATDQSQIGFLIHLKPWRLIQIALALQPEHVLSTPWGYVLMDLNQVLLLGLDGRPLGQFRLAIAETEEVTAITSTEQGFMIATGLGESATLYTIDLQPLVTCLLEQENAMDSLETTHNSIT
ncbi:MAG: serine/threonine protein kinase [Acaryochloridaceae cyanobacterium CSU_3_4]|nr:serine/threonine protein kinase [Acaryochloridaceae cyanobacterium CSU_3_4]